MLPPPVLDAPRQATTGSFQFGNGNRVQSQPSERLCLTLDHSCSFGPSGVFLVLPASLTEDCIRLMAVPSACRPSKSKMVCAALNKDNLAYEFDGGFGGKIKVMA